MSAANVDDGDMSAANVDDGDMSAANADDGDMLAANVDDGDISAEGDNGTIYHSLTVCKTSHDATPITEIDKVFRAHTRC